MKAGDNSTTSWYRPLIYIGVGVVATLGIWYGLSHYGVFNQATLSTTIPGENGKDIPNPEYNVFQTNETVKAGEVAVTKLDLTKVEGDIRDWNRAKDVQKAWDNSGVRGYWDGVNPEKTLAEQFPGKAKTAGKPPAGFKDIVLTKKHFTDATRANAKTAFQNHPKKMSAALGDHNARIDEANGSYTGPAGYRVGAGVFGGIVTCLGLSWLWGGEEAKKSPPANRKQPARRPASTGTRKKASTKGKAGTSATRKTDTNPDKDGKKSEGMSGTAIFLIILACLAALAGGVYIFCFMGKDEDEEFDEELEYGAGDP